MIISKEEQLAFIDPVLKSMKNWTFEKKSRNNLRATEAKEE